MARWDCSADSVQWVETQSKASRQQEQTSPIYEHYHGGKLAAIRDFLIELWLFSLHTFGSVTGRPIFLKRLQREIERDLRLTPTFLPYRSPRR